MILKAVFLQQKVELVWELKLLGLDGWFKAHLSMPRYPGHSEIQGNRIPRWTLRKRKRKQQNLWVVFSECGTEKSLCFSLKKIWQWKIEPTRNQFVEHEITETCSKAGWPDQEIGTNSIHTDDLNPCVKVTTALFQASSSAKAFPIIATPLPFKCPEANKCCAEVERACKTATCRTFIRAKACAAVATCVAFSSGANFTTAAANAFTKASWDETWLKWF